MTLVAAVAAAGSIASDTGVRIVVPLAILALAVMWVWTRTHQLGVNRGASEHRAATNDRITHTRNRIDDIRNQTDDNRNQIDDNRNRIDVLNRHSQEIRDLVNSNRERSDAADQKLRSDLVSRTWANTQMTREGLKLLRSELDELIQLSEPSAGLEDEIPAVVNGTPAISIAIPGYNRPDLLAQCLESIVAEVERSGTDRVEVWVTDDRSTRRSAIETARGFAERHQYIGFRLNPTNIGLERNLIEACHPCRGEFLLILGNDDMLHPGALDEMLADIDASRHDLMVYGKVRIDNEGEIISEPARGAIPDDSETGDLREYPDVLGFARSTGVLSGYGFISVVLQRRELFVAVDAEPYSGLTMYPQVGRILEAFARSDMLFRNVPIVFQRTTTRAEKLAEAVGRNEESFMAGGAERDMLWFGHNLAALLMRVCDNSPLEPAEFADVPEYLMGRPLLAEWMRANSELADDRSVKTDDLVRADSARFFAALGPDAVA